MRTPKVSIVVALAVACVLGLLWAVLKPATEQARAPEAIIDDVRSQTERLSGLDEFDDQATAYMDELMSSENFRVRARLSSFLMEAYRQGLISKSDLITRFTEMKDSAADTGKADYWDVVIGSVDQVEVEP